MNKHQRSKGILRAVVTSGIVVLNDFVQMTTEKKSYRIKIPIERSKPTFDNNYSAFNRKVNELVKYSKTSINNEISLHFRRKRLTDFVIGSKSPLCTEIREKGGGVTV